MLRYGAPEEGNGSGKTTFARWIVPIPDTTKLRRLEENLGAVEIELTPDDLREIDSATSHITVQGARYPEHLERRVER